jgi:UDP-N-acetyl-D-glucosamine dehydrogenase
VEFDLVVVGLGYVGLPLAEAACAAGLSVGGLDLDPTLTANLADGRSHVGDISDETVQRMLAQGFHPTSDPAILGSAAAITICVPTPLAADRTPDLAAVMAATATIATHLAPGTLVVLESTTYPGTTEEMVLPVLSAKAGTVGEDFFLAFSPERVDPGNATYGVKTTPKIVGGVTAECSHRVQKLYASFVDTVVVAGGTREAEMAKLLENTYRHVNIALVNEMAKFSHELGIDFWDVIRCASTKPFGFQAFWPGPGVGGHCIPIDPNYLSYRVRSSLGQSFQFVELATEINAGMPAYVVRRAQDRLNESAKSLRGSRVLLLGVSYKADVADTRETPAREVTTRLLRTGAVVTFYDQVATESTFDGAQRRDDLEAALREADLVIVLQLHAGVDYELVMSCGTPVLDTRGALSGPNVSRL